MIDVNGKRERVNDDGGGFERFYRISAIGMWPSEFRQCRIYGRISTIFTIDRAIFDQLKC